MKRRDDAACANVGRLFPLSASVINGQRRNSFSLLDLDSAHVFP